MSPTTSSQRQCILLSSPCEILLSIADNLPFGTVVDLMGTCRQAYCYLDWYLQTRAPKILRLPNNVLTRIASHLPENTAVADFSSLVYANWNLYTRLLTPLHQIALKMGWEFLDRVLLDCIVTNNQLTLGRFHAAGLNFNGESAIIDSAPLLNHAITSTPDSETGLALGRFLLENGADPAGSPYEDEWQGVILSPLSEAMTARPPNMEFVEMLFEFGCSANPGDDPSIFSPLYMACERDDEVCELLLKNGADTEWYDACCGLNPLLFSVYDGRASKVELLLKYGANPEATSSCGRGKGTPLGLATKRLIPESNLEKRIERLEIVRLLVEAGATNPIPPQTREKCI